MESLHGRIYRTSIKTGMSRKYTDAELGDYTRRYTLIIVVNWGVRNGTPEDNDSSRADYLECWDCELPFNQDGNKSQNVNEN